METRPLRKVTIYKELEKLAIIIQHVFERGWITEAERKNVEARKNLKDKKVEIYELIKNLKDFQNAARLLCAIRCIKENDDTVDGNTDTKGESQRSQENMQENFISKYSSLLIDQGLISLEENKLFLSTKMKNKRFKTEKGCRMRNAPIQNNRNPLEQSPVIRCLFGFLSLKDIKICRAVCKEWRNIGNSYLRLRSVIKFCNYHRVYSKFMELIESGSSRQPFHAFRIFGWRQYPWSDVQLTEFFDNQQEGIRELHLEHLYLNTTTGNKISTQDITPWISRTPMVKLANNYNTKLIINQLDTTETQEGLTVMKVPLELLTHIKDISLKLCSVHLKDGIKICPVNLDLNSLKFYKEGNSIPNIVINDIICLSKIKTLKLNVNSQYTRGLTGVSLDLQGNEKLDLEELTLLKVALLNWETCNWKVHKLNLCGIPFVEKTRMEITEFVFQTRFYDEEPFDLFALPDTIEKLSMNSDNNVICTGRLNLSRLKFLHIDIRDNPAIISHFRQCPALVEMVIEGSSDMQLQLKTTWIPQSVRILKLVDMALNSQEGSQLCLEKLVLKNYSFSAAKEMMTNSIQIDCLVLICQPCWFLKDIYQVNELGVCHSSQTDEVAFVDFFQHVNSLNSCQKIYVGPFNWDNPFKSSPMARYVDKQNRFYVFENRKGKSIREEEFNNESSFPNAYQYRIFQ